MVKIPAQFQENWLLETRVARTYHFVRHKDVRRLTPFTLNNFIVWRVREFSTIQAIWTPGVVTASVKGSF